MNLKSTFVLLISAAMATTACRSQDFLYYQKPVPRPASIEQQRSIRELVKGSDLVDILWVIDNSGSMESFQQAVIDNTDVFMQEFVKKGNVRWRMGLISTDESSRPYLGFSAPFDWTNADPVSAFQIAVGSLGTSGSGNEESFTPILNAIGAQPDFLRPGAATVIISVTDAPEQSDISAAQFSQSLAQLRGGRSDELVAYGVFGAIDMGCVVSAGETPWNYQGSEYFDFINPLGGKIYPICQPFGPSLSDLAQDIVKRVTSPVLYLGQRPNPATLQVLYHGKVIPGGSAETGGFWFYDYDRVALVFHDLSFAPGNEEDIVIKFEAAE